VAAFRAQIVQQEGESSDWNLKESEIDSPGSVKEKEEWKE